MTTTFPFKLADSGDAIRDIQRKLASLDPNGDPDLLSFHAELSTGIFDAATANAIRAFKKLNGDAEPVGECDEKTWHMLNDQAGSVFGETWQFEMDALRGDLPENVEPVRDKQTEEAHRHQFAGLAFSGGGIRSATFNLGTLQALAELRMLRDFDYLSTVSGGGYIGAWFSKWLKGKQGNIVNLERELTPGSPEIAKREPEEVKLVRQYTKNFMTLKTGFFSADTWARLTTYARNTVLNLTILTLLLVAVMVVPRLLALFVNEASGNKIAWLANANAVLPLSVFSIVGVVAAMWSVYGIAASVSSLPVPDSKHGHQSQNSIISFIVMPLMVAAFFGSVALWENHAIIGSAWNNLLNHPSTGNPILVWLFAPGLCFFLAWAAGWYCARRYNHRLILSQGKSIPEFTWKEARIESAGHFLCAITALAVGTALVVMSISALDSWYMERGATAPIAGQAVTRAAQMMSIAARVPGVLPQNTTVPVIAFGMPMLLSLFGITMIIHVGLSGRLYTDKTREWWGRQGGWTAIFVIAWLAVITTSLYVPGVVAYFNYHKFGDWARAILGSAWLATTLGGLLLGKSSVTGDPNGKLRMDWLASTAPIVFSVGALCLASTLLHALLLPHGGYWQAHTDKSFLGFLKYYDHETMMASSAKLWLALGGLLASGLLLAWRVDINKFSLHMMYRNRLMRAYLGASNPKRQPHPFTGSDPADDEHMDDLLATNGRIQRPYHIINTALNLVDGKELASHTRKAANFTFTPAFCGFELPSMAAPGGARLAHEAMRGGFRRTAAYRPGSAASTARNDEERGINLGMAATLSGGAASPSRGYHSSPPLAFLMSVFNVRLGRWFANPIHPIPSTKGNAILPPRPPRTSPGIGLWDLFKELFGMIDARSKFVYLSDGGHFENLGLYELVRRRCRLVVVVDAGPDGPFDFPDLGNAIRKCRTDLSVEVEIDVGGIDLPKSAEFSLSHCVTGTIRYDKVDQGAPAGTLLYIKPSLLGTEFADVLNYRKTNKNFPHEPTSDQRFDETQFEMYRSLGYTIGKIAFAKAAATASKNGLGRHDVASLCHALHANWDNPTILKEESQKARKTLHLVEERRIGASLRRGHAKRKSKSKE